MMSIFKKLLLNFSIIIISYFFSCKEKNEEFTV